MNNLKIIEALEKGLEKDLEKALAAKPKEALAEGTEEDLKKNCLLMQELAQAETLSDSFQIHLLFEERVERPAAKAVQVALEQRLGQADMVSSPWALSTFALQQYPVKHADGSSLPAQVTMGLPIPFQPERISMFERGQLWDSVNGEELLEACTCSLMLSNLRSAGLPLKQLAKMMVGWVEVALALFPSCKAIWVPSGGKLIPANKFLRAKLTEYSKFVYLAVNARFFNIQGTQDLLVDTLGLYAVDLPDLQYHFHDLDPDMVMNHAYDVACYVFQARAIIKSGETITGLDEKGHMCKDVKWKCEYEKALIQPGRKVIDICADIYASEKRAEL